MAERFPSDLAEKILVRAPDGMRDRLAALAKGHGRSSNAEAVKALDVWIRQFEWLDAAADGRDPGPWPNVKFDPFPEALRNRLLDAARLNGRTSDAEAIARLEASFAQPADAQSPEHVLSQDVEDRLAVLVGKAMENALSNSDLLRRVQQIEGAQINDKASDNSESEPYSKITVVGYSGLGSYPHPHIEHQRADEKSKQNKSTFPGSTVEVTYDYHKKGETH